MTRRIAKQLLAFEGVEATSATSEINAVSRVCDKLRRPFATLCGVAGFRSLLERALTVATQECPALDAWKVEPDGSLEGLDGNVAQSGTVLIAQLIGLMITFIGESLTLRLLQDTWPSCSSYEGSSERSGFE